MSPAAAACGRAEAKAMKTATHLMPRFAAFVASSFQREKER
jgi:hypothetical protein